MEKILFKNDATYKSRITIAIPTYGRSKLIEHTLRSVFEQTGKVSYNLLVVSNDSDDESCKNLINLLKNYVTVNIRLYRNINNVGMIGNWNKCFELAQTEFVMLLHDDDLLSLNALSSFEKHLEEVDCVSGVTKLFGKIRKKNKFSRSISKWQNWIKFHGKESKDLSIYDALYRCPITTSGSIIRKSVFKNIGGFDDTIFPGSDYKFNLTMVSKYKVRLLNSKLIHYRIHSNASHSREVLLNSANSYHDVRLECFRLIVEDKKYQFVMRKLILTQLKLIYFLESRINSLKINKTIYSHILIKVLTTLLRIVHMAGYLKYLLK